MNQNNNQTQQSSQVSQEELAKTQVLNLNDVKELARFERKTSKKPALLFAIAGVLSISLGFAYPNIMTALDNAPVAKSETSQKDNTNTDANLVQNKVQSNEQICKYVSEANVDGTKGSVTYTLQYNENNQLQNYTMVLAISPLEGNAEGVTATQNIYNVYKAVDAVPVTGYKMTTTLTDSGMQSVAVVDLTKLNKSTLTTMHTGNIFANVPFNLGDTKETVAATITPNGFTCE